MTSNRAKKRSDPRSPSSALTSLIAFFVLSVIGTMVWRFGSTSALYGTTVALLCVLVGYRLGVTFGMTRGARALAELREALVSAEAQIVRAQLDALKAPLRGDGEKLLTEETARRERAEGALAEERNRIEALQRQSEKDFAEERRHYEQWRKQTENAIAEERQRFGALQHDTEAKLAEERSQRHLAEERAAQATRLAERLASEVAAKRADHNGALSEVARLLAPIVEREKLLLDLAAVDGAQRDGLPAILDAIASKGHFLSIVLADESGLPLAASQRARNAESIAATSSLLYTLADRMVECGAPPPLAVLVHDEANEMILHRLFRVQGGRYILTATGRGRGVVPETLDPALHTIERALQRDAWTA